MANAYALTYQGLIDNVTSYLERKDTAVLNQIPFAILLAESKLSNELKQLGQLSVVRAPVNTQTMSIPGVLAKPTRWRRTVSMKLIGNQGSAVQGQKIPLYLRTLEYCSNYWPDASVTDTPLYYADYDFNNWVIVPTPASSIWTLESLIYQRLEPLSDQQQTNWFTINAPEAMFYGTLLEMIPFLKNDQRMATWQPMYDRAVDALKVQDGERTVDRSTVKPENA